MAGDAIPGRPLTAPDVVAGLLADVAERDERLAACRANNAAIAVQLDQYRNERDELRALVAEMDAAMGPRPLLITNPQRAGWRKRAGLEAGGGQPADVRPRDGEPGWLDVTCGGCGEEFGTNFAAAELECPGCEARRCPSCHAWFGGDGG